VSRRLPDCNTSPRRRRTFNRCPAAYRYQYVDKWPQEGSGPEARIGKAVHAAIENAALDALYGKGPHKPTAEALEQHLLLVAATEVQTPAELEQARERLLSGLNFYDFTGMLCAPEEPWTVHLGEGLIDGGVFDLVKGEPEGEVWVVDWKTGDRPAPSEEELAEDPQVGAYLVAAHDRWPKAKSWAMREVFVAQGEVREVRWTRALDDAHRRMALATQAAIERGYDKPTVGAHCGYCGFRDRCKAFLKAVNVEVGAPPAWDDVEELLAEAQRIRTLEKLVEARRKTVDEAIRSRLKKDKRLQAGELEAFWKTRRVRRVDPAAIATVARGLGCTVSDAVVLLGADVSARKLDALVKANPHLAGPVKSHVSTFEVRWPEIREVKEEVPA
jgi:RecB family exonuclease